MRCLPLLLQLIVLQACAASNNCENSGSQLQMTLCSKQNLANLEVELQKKQAELAKVLGVDHLKLAISAWENYRDAHCTSTSNIYSGGSLYDYAFAECKAKLTRIRIESLDEDYQDSNDIIMQGSP